MGSPFFTIFIHLFIYYYCYYFYRVPPITLWGLLPFAVELPFSLLGSSPSHCGLLSFSLSHWVPAWGPFASHSSEGLLLIFPWGSSPCYYGGCLPSWLLGSPPFLAGAHPHLVHSTVGLPHISVGLPHIAVGLFTISSWGFVSLWGSSPSRSLNCGASPSRSLNSGAYPHLCGALHHLSVGLHLAVGLFPISLTQLWGFSTSLCWSLSPLSVGLPFTEGLFPLSLTQLHTHSTVALDWFLYLAPGSVK